MKFVEIVWQTDRYTQELELRDRLLRAPLGLKFDPGEITAERDQLHFGVFEADDQLVACVVAVPLTEQHVKLRQMAVDEPWQGQGIGATLMSRTEQALAERGFEWVELNARDLAVGFYEKLGYRPEGDPFVEVTIPHQKMAKSITPIS